MTGASGAGAERAAVEFRQHAELPVLDQRGRGRRTVEGEIDVLVSRPWVTSALPVIGHQQICTPAALLNRKPVSPVVMVPAPKLSLAFDAPWPCRLVAHRLRVVGRIDDQKLHGLAD